MKKVKTLIMIGLTTCVGCSAFRPAQQTMNISVSPSDAIVMVNGQRYTPPVQVNVRRDRDVSIQCYKDGYTPYMRTIGNHMNGTGSLDVVGTVLFLVPGIGLLTPGAYSLDETDIGISLYPQK